MRACGRATASSSRTAGDAGLPVAVAMSGGYAPDIDAIVQIHLATIEEAARHAARWADTRA